MDLSIVIPAYNEERRINSTLQDIKTFLGNWKECPQREIIVVSDGSTDKTCDVVEAFKKDLPEIRIVDYTPNRGKGYALKQGFKASSGDIVVFTDADGSTPAYEIGEFVKLMKNNDWDMIMGSRRHPDSNVEDDQPKIRKMLGNIFSLFIRILMWTPFHDYQCGFKIFKGEVGRSLFEQSKCDGFTIDVELLMRALKQGLTVKEVGIEWHNNPETRVKCFKDGIKMAFTALKLRFSL